MRQKLGSNKPDRGGMWGETPSGRPGRKPEKINLRSVAAILQERGIEPIGAICDVLGQLDPPMQARTLLSLTEFVYPKLGRTEMTGKDGKELKGGVVMIPAKNA